MAAETAPNELAPVTPVCIYRPADPAEAVEFDSFLLRLPELGRTHAGQFVAVSAGHVVASGLYLDPVLRQARAATRGEPFYCGWVEPPAGHVFRFGSPALLAETSSE